MVGAVGPITGGVSPATFQRTASVSRDDSGAASPRLPGTETESPEQKIIFAAPANPGQPKPRIAGAPPEEDEAKSDDPSGLSDEEKAEVEELKKRDQEVRQHEAAHQSAGGSYAGAASFSYQAGPDGKRYAVGGEVSIDTAAIPGDPAATIQKLRTVAAAALAPAEPSGQDRAVAAAANAAIAQAQGELAKQKTAEVQGGGEAETKAKPEDGRFAKAAGVYGATAAPKGADTIASLIGGLVA